MAKGRCVTGAVQHAFYGCDSGCDGYEVVGWDEHGIERHREFYFERPTGEDPWVWAEKMLRQYLPSTKLVREACQWDYDDTPERHGDG